MNKKLRATNQRNYYENGNYHHSSPKSHPKIPISLKNLKNLSLEVVPFLPKQSK